MRDITLLQAALRDIVAARGLPWPAKASIEPPKDSKHGDLAANIAMMLAKEARKNPRDLAQEIAGELRERVPHIISASVAGPGFINVTFSPQFWHETALEAHAQGARYGASDTGKGLKTQVEFVSANPTGPLHIGHGRGAAVGDSLARVLRFAGYAVSTEYYINDAGLQMRLLGTSVWLQARNLKQLPVEWPDNFYRGAYIVDIARAVLEQYPDLLEMDAEKAKDICYEYAMNDILNGIKQDLKDFRVEHQVWFSEKSLVDKGAVANALQSLKTSGQSYEEDGALWFATSAYGDDKNRVLRKSDGTLTYFASDIAYHDDKFKRGFNYLIDVWGADHHGYIPRMRAAIAALGKEQSQFEVVLIQLVNLLQNGVPVSMSTRAGTFTTLSDVLREVGTDAARFMFLSRKSDSPLDFDLESVKQRSMDNPVYYVQYAHARICAVLRRAGEAGITLPTPSLDVLAPLQAPEDLALLRMVNRFEGVVASAARELAPHLVCHYLQELAGLLHGFYAREQVLRDDDRPLTLARLTALGAVAQVLRNGLDLLGVSAPDHM